MNRAVALVLSLSMLVGCFPHNKRARMYSQLAEGGAIVAGIGTEFLVSSDCDTTPRPGMSSSCHSHAEILGDVGVGLIIAGLLGFLATISTAEDEDDNKPRIEIKADQPRPVEKLPPVVLPAAPPALPALPASPAAPAAEPPAAPAPAP